MKGEWKRAMGNWYMFLSVAVLLYILGSAYRSYSWGWKQQSALMKVANPMALSGLTPFAGLFPMLPCGFLFVEDYNTGYIRFQLLRQGRRSYMGKRLLVTMVTGGLVMALAFGGIFLMAIISGNPVTQETIMEADVYSNTVWWPIVTVWGGKLVLLLKLILAFEFGAVWSTVCLLISALFTNRYVCFMCTFVIYQVLWYLMPGSRLNPVYLLRGDTGGYTHVYEPLLIQGVILALLGAGTWLCMERKLKDV